MKKAILGLMAAISLVSGLSAVAEAKTSVHVYLGVPYYDYRVGPDYLYDRGRGWYRPVNRQQLVCLVTFFRRDQVAGGADADVERARVLPRRVAERLDRPGDRNRIFTYGSNRKTRETCDYLNNLDNSNNGGGMGSGNGNGNEPVCLVTFFDPDQVAGGADADVERARVLPRRVAEDRDGPNDRNRIFTYGSPQKTAQTCDYLDNLNN